MRDRPGGAVRPTARLLQRVPLRPVQHPRPMQRRRPLPRRQLCPALPLGELHENVAAQRRHGRALRAVPAPVGLDREALPRHGCPGVLPAGLAQPHPPRRRRLGELRRLRGRHDLLLDPDRGLRPHGVHRRPLPRERRAAGAAGYPIGVTERGLRDGGWLHRFQNGAFTDSRSTSTQSVWGYRWTRWVEHGRENGRLGYPVEPMTPLPDGWIQVFQKGVCRRQHLDVHPGRLRLQLEHLGRPRP